MDADQQSEVVRNEIQAIASHFPASCATQRIVLRPSDYARVLVCLCVNSL